MSHGQALRCPGDFISNQAEMGALRSKEQVHEFGSLPFGKSHNLFGGSISERDPKSVESLKLNFGLDKDWLGLRHGALREECTPQYDPRAESGGPCTG